MVSATVYSPSGTMQNDSVSLAQLQSGPQCTAYSGNGLNELGRNGFVDVPLPPSGAGSGTWALSTVLGCLSTPIPVSAVHGVIVIDSQGSPEVGPGSMLTPTDLAPQGSTDFNNPQEAPVVEALGSVNQYDRPWRGNGQGQTDEDFLDEVQETQSDQPTPIAIEVFEGPLLTVTVSASQTTVPVGQAITFDATVTGQNGSALSYSWKFDGGAQGSTAPSPQVTFGNTGQYDVTVEVTDDAGGGGGAEIPITVGTPPAAATGRHHKKGAGKSKKSPSPTGPQKSGGNHTGGRAGNSSSGNSTTTGKGSGTKAHIDHADDRPPLRPRRTARVPHDGLRAPSHGPLEQPGPARDRAPGATDSAPTCFSTARRGPAGQRREAAGGKRQPARPQCPRGGGSGASRTAGDPGVGAAGSRRSSRHPRPPGSRSRTRAAWAPRPADAAPSQLRSWSSESACP